MESKSFRLLEAIPRRLYVFFALFYDCSLKFFSLVKMSEKLCLQWNDFKQNVNSAFGSLRNDKDFTNVTLACEDGQEIEAHKVILAASSPFF